MTNPAMLANLAARHSGRPLLMLPDAAQDLANRLYYSMPSALESGSRFDAALRLIGVRGRARPAAFDDDDAAAQSVPDRTGPLAYAPLWMGEPDDELDWGMSLKDGVATLNLDTAISDRGTAWCGSWWHGYDSLDAAMRTAFADDRVKGIFLRVDSPGGVVSGGLDVLTRTLREGREAAGGKPVWAYADCAASAAYWIAAQTDRILAPRAGLVGSIGAVIVHMENAVMLAKHGVTVTPIEFGGQKTAGASFKPLDDIARADLQGFVDQAGRDFIAAVSEGRPSLAPEALLATQARIYSADHAEPDRSGLALGFVDEIASEADAFAALVAHLTPAGSAAASAVAPASTPAARTGAGSMAKPAQAAARRKAEMKALTARMAAIRAEEELDELEAEGEEEDPEAEGDEIDPAAEGDEANPAAEGEEEDPEAEGEEEDPELEGDEDGKTPAARSRLRKLAIAGLPEARANPDFARSLAAQGFSVAAARKALQAAARTNAITARTDRPVSGRPAGGASVSKSQELVGDYVAAAGTSRLRKKPA